MLMRTPSKSIRSMEEILDIPILKSKRYNSLYPGLYDESVFLLAYENPGLNATVPFLRHYKNNKLNNMCLFSTLFGVLTYLLILFRMLKFNEYPY